MQRKLIAVAYTLRTDINQFSLGRRIDASASVCLVSVEDKSI